MTHGTFTFKMSLYLHWCLPYYRVFRPKISQPSEYQKDWQIAKCCSYKSLHLDHSRGLSSIWYIQFKVIVNALEPFWILFSLPDYLFEKWPLKSTSPLDLVIPNVISPLLKQNLALKRTDCRVHCLNNSKWSNYFLKR